MSQNIALTIEILDKQYQISCASEEELMLKASAEYLSQQMREIRDRGNIIGSDRIAVMAALNIAYDLLQLKDIEKTQSEVRRRITDMQQSVAKLLNETSIAKTSKVD